MTDTEAAILHALYGPQVQHRPIEHRVFTVFYNPATKVGKRLYDAAKEIERRSLGRISAGTQPNVYQVFPRI